MLELRPNCELCDCDLDAQVAGAYICSFECTFCTNCAEVKLHKVCPNCNGELLPRPTRSAALLNKYPASTVRIHSDKN